MHPNRQDMGATATVRALLFRLRRLLSRRDPAQSFDRRQRLASGGSANMGLGA